MIKPYFIFEITSRCTGNCLFCYNVWKQDKDYPKGELSLSEIKKLIGKLAGETTPAGFTLAGGEPLLHKNIKETVSFLAEIGIKPGIASNGMLLDEGTAQELVKRGAGYFEISLMTADDGKFARLTRGNSFKKAKQAIINVKNERAKLTVSCVLTKRNADDLEETIDLSFALSADALALNRFVPGGRGLEHLPELFLSKAELEKALTVAERKSAELNMTINVTIPVESCVIDQKRFPNLNFGSCACGRNKWVIDPLGNLRTCEQNPRVLGSLFNHSFAELAQSRTAELFRSDDLKSNCGDCEAFRHCGGGCRFARGGQADSTSGDTKQISLSIHS